MSLQVLLLFVCAWSSVVSYKINFYRKDYVYLEKYNAYYKMHFDENPASWDEAFLTCDDEGAKLFYPQLPEETGVGQILLEKEKLKPDHVKEIYIGLRKVFGAKQFIFIDGEITPQPWGDDCVLLDIKTGQYINGSNCATMNRPFICKKTDDVIRCPTVDPEYIYEPVANKCYKISLRPRKWLDAVNTCYEEGGNLAVIKEEVDYKAIQHRLQETKLPQRRQERDYSFFVGFRSYYHQFYNIKGKRIDDGGWYNSNFKNDNTEDTGMSECGAINLQVETFTEDCSVPHKFVCEMKLK